MIAKDMAFVRTIYGPYLYHLAASSDVDKEVVAGLLAALTDINARVGELECDVDVRLRAVSDVVGRLDMPADDAVDVSAIIAQAETLFATIRAEGKLSNVVSFPQRDRAPA